MFAPETFGKRAEMGNEPSTESTTRVPRTSWSEETAQSVPETLGRTYYLLPWSAQGLRKQEKRSDSCAAKEGANKLVSSVWSKN
jgi:hypothetical protein